MKQATILNAGTGLIAFTGKKWENRRVDRQLPVQVADPLHLQYTVVPQEHQPIPLLLFNITDRLLNVRVQISSSSTQDASASLLFLSPVVYRSGIALIERFIT